MVSIPDTRPAHQFTGAVRNTRTGYPRAVSMSRRKRVPWKQEMLHALEAGRVKLDEYYSQTGGI